MVRGIVQGVGFRPTVHRIAEAMGLNGWVRNDGTDVVIEVDKEHDRFLKALKEQLPPLALIEDIDVQDSELELEEGFHIKPSAKGSRGAGIPVDTAICNFCIEEMRKEGDRRNGYPFTSCTDCGARFTLISDLPYDRPNTAYSSFPHCEACGREYASSGDRRFHHQTVCCPECGPRYRLIDKEGTHHKDPIALFARILDEGGVGVAKSWGGMHICSSIDNIPHLRRWYGREHKPFAIMVKDVDSIYEYGLPDETELKELRSPQRPIVLIPKKDTPRSESASPGLDTIGVFLPYTGMHHLLFDELDDDALVMTSANVPGEPMIVDDDNVLSLGADAYLLHDQHILNRADDSVLRVFDGDRYFIRRSRGHTPAWLSAPSKGTVVALGAQENIAGTVAHDGRMYSTQYVGDADHLGVLDYLESSISHLRRLLGADEVSHVALDMHPGYSNRRLARAMAEGLGAETIEVQHHWAHAASLLVDEQKDEAVILALDGSGYGDDGSAWGGEVMYSTLDSYERVGHLRAVPLLGGEKAVYDIRRLCFAFDSLAGRENNMFSDRDSRVLEIMMGKSVMSSSMGRLMDALSCYLDVCQHRSYDGEPAMRLEALLARGSMMDGFQAEVHSGVVDSVTLIADVMETAGRPEDKAYTVVSCLIDAMVDIAADRALEKGIGDLGLSGGVTYNRAVNQMVSRRAEQRGMRMLRHRNVPNGDGGVSVGQAAIALRRSS